MSVYSEIRKKLQEITGVDLTTPIQCEVVSVEGISCTVKIAGGLELSDVRLRATLATGDNQLLIIPKKGTKALILSVDGTLNDLTLIKCDEVEKIEYKQEDLEVVIDSVSKKVMIKNNQASLKGLFSTVHDFITNIKLSTPSGPTASVIYPDPVQLNDFQTAFNNLLND